MRSVNLVTLATSICALGFAIYSVVITNRTELALLESERKLAQIRELLGRSQEGAKNWQARMERFERAVEKSETEKAKSLVTRSPEPVQTGGTVVGVLNGTNATAGEAFRIAALESKRVRYEAFLQSRNLTAGQAQRVLELLTEQDYVRRDLQQAIRQQGIAGDGRAVDHLRAQFYEPVTRELRQILGEDGYAAFGKYEQFSFVRAAHIEPLFPQFEAAQSPLRDDQISRLTSLVLANQWTERMAKTDLSAQSRVNWNAVVQQAAQILDPAQLRVLEVSVLHMTRTAPKPSP